MNGHGYVVSPTAMKPPPLGAQEVNYRWPHVGGGGGGVDRDGGGGGGGMSTAHVMEKNYTPSHVMEKNSYTSPRVEGKYTAVRNPCDVRSRYDASSLMHEEQQRLHALYMEQIYRGSGADMRALQVSTDMRSFPVYDSRQSMGGGGRKVIDESSAHELSKSFLEAQHYQQDVKGYSDGERCFQNPYPSNVSSLKLSHEGKRCSSDMNEHHNGKDGGGGGGGVLPPPLTPSHHLPPPQQKTMEPLSSGNPMFAEHVGNLANIKEEEDKRSITEATGKKGGGEHFAHFLDTSNSASEKLQNLSKEKENNEEHLKQEQTDNNNMKNNEKHDTESSSTSEKSPTEKFSAEEVSDNGLPSYTAMIAQAILKKSSKSTLSDIYEYMEKTFPSLEKRGTGWRNCVRHTLSLNDCFLKLHRPENGRSCNWTIHPSYYESFSRGDYRKKRALRKRARGLQWMDPINFNGYSLMREYDVHPDVSQQQHTALFHHPPPAGMWLPPPPPQNGYNCSFVQTSPDHLHHLPSHPSPSHPSPTLHPPPSPYTTAHHLNHPGQFESSNCTNAECYCQYNRNNCRVYSM